MIPRSDSFASQRTRAGHMRRRGWWLKRPSRLLPRDSHPLGSGRKGISSMLLNDDFLLTTEWARRLFHDHAEKMPIIDYPLPPRPAPDLRGRALLGPRPALDLRQRRRRPLQVAPHARQRDARAPHHRRRRALREVPRLRGHHRARARQPALRVEPPGAAPRPSGSTSRSAAANAEEIWRRAGERIAEADFSAKGLIRAFDVRCVCTTDDPGERPRLAQAARRRGGRERRLQGPADLPPRRPHGHRQA